MLSLQDILNKDLFFTGIPGESKKRVFELIGDSIHRKVDQIPARDIFDQLFARERLGSTGVGFGVAIPHCRMEHCDHPIGAFFRLENAIDFDAHDGQPVDLLFVLLVPNDEKANQQHLILLKNLAELMSDERNRERLRQAKQIDDIYAIFNKINEAK